MALSFKNAQDIVDPWTHWFFYGESGAGKTTVAATFPSPVFLVPKNENSVVTLRGLDIPYYEITEPGSVDGNKPVVAGVGSMFAVLTELEREYNKDPDAFPFETIVIESLSHYSDLVVESVSKQGRLNMDHRRWGDVATHFRTLHSRLCALDVHVVYIALAKTETNAEGTPIRGIPLLQGAAAVKLPGACGTVAYCELRGGKYYVHTRKRGIFGARSRYDALPPEIQNFDFGKVKHLLAEPNRSTTTAAGDR